MYTNGNCRYLLAECVFIYNMQAPNTVMYSPQYGEYITVLGACEIAATPWPPTMFLATWLLFPCPYLEMGANLNPSLSIPYEPHV